jgi:glycosyltransferase involved in cell wall biosynthesis
MTTALPHVTVVTPVFNGETYLAECIDSVLAQTHVAWDLVLVDNRSTDGTADIARAYAARDPRIRVVTNDEHVGVIRNHNIAVRQTAPHAAYCKVLQADDWMYPECLAEMVAAAEAHPDAGLVGAFALHGDRVRCDGLPVSSRCLPGRDVARLNLLGDVYTFLSPSVLLIRADLARSRDPYYDEADLHADVEACYEVLKRADLAFVHRVLVFVRRQRESLTGSHSLRYNTLPLSNLELLVQFGPDFLGTEEFARRRQRLLRHYYDTLVRALLRSPERDALWRMHAERMRAIGLPLSRMRVARAWLRGVFTRAGRVG